MVNHYSISQLTKEFDISTRTLRFYEDEGLLQPERRGRTRLYSPADRRTIAKILMARRVGFTISEISELLKLDLSLPNTAKQLKVVMDQVEKKRQELRNQRRDLEMMVDELDNLEDACLAKLAEIGVST
ncbi:MAG: MerR family DNA-binding transcriptional regulator [Rhizobiaceae bacterium]|nr:MerR family DNA-binding transcriptional regulator [Rhizobiaceae bacterium]